MLAVGMVRVLNNSAHVAGGITQILRKSVCGKEIEPVRKALVQRCLKSVIEHLQLCVVERKHGCHVGLLRKITSAKVRLGAFAISVDWTAEVRILNHGWLVQIARLVVPKVIGARAHVAHLRYPTLAQLMLNAQ